MCVVGYTIQVCVIVLTAMKQPNDVCISKNVFPLLSNNVTVYHVLGQEIAYYVFNFILCRGICRVPLGTSMFNDTSTQAIATLQS